MSEKSSWFASSFPDGRSETIRTRGLAPRSRLQQRLDVPEVQKGSSREIVGDGLGIVQHLEVCERETIPSEMIGPMLTPTILNEDFVSDELPLLVPDGGVRAIVARTETSRDGV